MKKKTILWLIFFICLGCTLLLVSVLRIWQALEDLGIYDSTLLCAVEIFVAILGTIFGLVVLFGYAPKEIEILQKLKTEKQGQNTKQEDLKPTRETMKYRSKKMNKKNQIEEMAKIVDEYFEVYCTTPKDIAESLYEAGYRKVPTGGVVLTAEGNSDYITAKHNYEYVKDVAERLKAELNKLSRHLGIYIKNARKETAAEIFKWLKAHSDDAGFIIIKTYFAERFGVLEDETK